MFFVAGDKGLKANTIDPSEMFGYLKDRIAELPQSEVSQATIDGSGVLYELTFSKPFFFCCCPIYIYHFFLVDYVQILKKYEPNLAINEGGLLKESKIVAKLFFSREVYSLF